MTTQTVICLTICLIVIVNFIWGKFSMGTTAMMGLVLFRLTGCISNSDVVSYLGNSNGIIVVCMFILSAGLVRTQMIDNLTTKIAKIADGSLTKIFFGFMLLMIMLNQFIGQGVAEFAIVAPLLGLAVDKINVSRSKVMYPIVVVCVACMGWTPVAQGLAKISTFNGLIQSFNITNYEVGIFDSFLMRAPSIIGICIYALTIGLKIAPDKPQIPIEIAGNEKKEKEKLPMFQEVCGYTIFFGTCAALIIASVTKWFDGYIVCMAGVILMLLTGVLSPKDVQKALPLSFYALFAGAFAMGGALSNTGGAEVLGNAVAGIIGSNPSTFKVYFIFFMIPLILTQFMMNSAVQFSFIPVALAASVTMGINPVGIVLLINEACTTAYMTPMACPPVTAAMSAGGYDFKNIFRQSILPTVIKSVSGIAMACILFPLF